MFGIIKIGDFKKIIAKLRNSDALIEAAKRRFTDLNEDEKEIVVELSEEIAKTLENNEYTMRKEMLI